MINWEVYRDAIVRYRKWLDAQNPAACKSFLRRLDLPDITAQQGALGEALAWNWLEPRCNAVHLNEDPGTGGVDFQCDSDVGSFYVEVTTVTIDKATNSTGLDHYPLGKGPKFYATATTAIKEKIGRKSKQVAGLQKPLVIFVVTLHFEWSAVALLSVHLEELLVGASGIAATINLRTGESGESQAVRTFDHPLFFSAGTSSPRRRHVSAVLLGGFGLRPPDCIVRGVLHPDPVRPFNVGALPETCFGSIQPWPLNDESRILWRTASGKPCDDVTLRKHQLAEAERRLRKEGLGEYLDSLRTTIRSFDGGC